MDEVLEAATALSVAMAKKEKTAEKASFLSLSVCPQLTLEIAVCSQEKAWLVGLRGSTRYGSKLISQAVSVKQGVVPNIIMPLPNPPRFQDNNLDVLGIDGSATKVSDGVMVDSEGNVLALWASFPLSKGAVGQAIPSVYLQDAIKVRHTVCPEMPLCLPWN